jgi:uncharacterized protein
MTVYQTTQCTAFDRDKLVAQGTAREVRAAIAKLRAQNPYAVYLVFDDATGEDFYLEGSLALPADPTPNPDVDPAQEARPAVPASAVRPGRPKLGVVAREVTLLPRHWEWLETQPGGASVALRKLVEAARKEHAPEDRIRRAIEATYRFLSVMCGNKPGFEETARALFRRNWHDFDELVAALPGDLGRHLQQLSKNARPERQGNAEH